MRFFCIPIHPMRIGNTMMNSFLFNVCRTTTHRARPPTHADAVHPPFSALRDSVRGAVLCVSGLAAAALCRGVRPVLLHRLPVVRADDRRRHAAGRAGAQSDLHLVVHQESVTPRVCAQPPNLIPLLLQVRNLIFISWFFNNNFFFYVMMGITGLTFTYLCVFPHEKRALDDD